MTSSLHKRFFADNHAIIVGIKIVAGLDIRTTDIERDILLPRPQLLCLEGAGTEGLHPQFGHTNFVDVADRAVDDQP